MTGFPPFRACIIQTLIVDGLIKLWLGTIAKHGISFSYSAEPRFKPEPDLDLGIGPGSTICWTGPEVWAQVCWKIAEPGPNWTMASLPLGHPDALTGMHIISCSIWHHCQNSAIVSVDTIYHGFHFISQCGSHISHEWTTDNVLNLAGHFYLNYYIDVDPFTTSKS